MHSEVSTKMICGGISSVISFDFLLESYRFRRLSNGMIRSFAIGVFKPILSCFASQIFGDHFYTISKKIINNEIYK